MMLLAVDPMHASTITALVVNQNESSGTSLTDVTKNVVLTAENVDVALTLVEMIEVSALKASAFVS